MSFKTSTVSALAISALALSSAYAQTTTRDDVKAEARATATPSQPKGEQNPLETKTPKSAPTAESRMDVKVETVTANKSQRIAKGERSPRLEDPKKKSGASETTRAEVRSETKAANKAKEIPAGETSQKGPDKGGAKS